MELKTCELRYTKERSPKLQNYIFDTSNLQKYKIRYYSTQKHTQQPSTQQNYIFLTSVTKIQISGVKQQNPKHMQPNQCIQISKRCCM